MKGSYENLYIKDLETQLEYYENLLGTVDEQLEEHIDRKALSFLCPTQRASPLDNNGTGPTAVALRVKHNKESEQFIKDSKKYNLVTLAPQQCGPGKIVTGMYDVVKEILDSSSAEVLNLDYTPELSASDLCNKLYNKLLGLSNSIASGTRRGAGNNIVCSEHIINILKHNDRLISRKHGTYGLGRFDIVVSKEVPRYTILMSYVGSHSSDGGIVLAHLDNNPNILWMYTPVDYDKYYQVLHVVGLNNNGL